MTQVPRYYQEGTDGTKGKVSRRKTGGLPLVEHDKAQRRAYYERNKAKIAAKSRDRYVQEKKAKLTLTKAQRLAKSKGVDGWVGPQPSFHASFR
jgi:hypothetical protein